MSKMTLEFDLDDEREEATISYRANTLFLCLNEILNDARTIAKYEREGYDPDQAEKWRELLWQHVTDYDLGDLF